MRAGARVTYTHGAERHVALGPMSWQSLETMSELVELHVTDLVAHDDDDDDDDIDARVKHNDNQQPTTTNQVPQRQQSTSRTGDRIGDRSIAAATQPSLF